MGVGLGAGVVVAGVAGGAEVAVDGGAVGAVVGDGSSPLHPVAATARMIAVTAILTPTPTNLACRLPSFHDLRPDLWKSWSDPSRCGQRRVPRVVHPYDDVGQRRRVDLLVVPFVRR